LRAEPAAWVKRLLKEGARVTVAPVGGDGPSTLFASVPLTDEAWRPIPEGRVVAVVDGEIVAEG